MWGSLVAVAPSLVGSALAYIFFNVSIIPANFGEVRFGLFPIIEIADGSPDLTAERILEIQKTIYDQASVGALVDGIKSIVGNGRLEFDCTGKGLLSRHHRGGNWNFHVWQDDVAGKWIYRDCDGGV